jgi:hypothetical protein
MNGESPVVCLVDDQPSKAEATLRGGIGTAAVIRPRHPEELTIADLTSADVILVDFELRTSWTRVVDLPITRHPPDGLALAAVIRAHLDTVPAKRARAIALYSAELQRVGAQLPAEVRGYALARLHDLEWVFEKMDPDAGRKILALAEAVRSLHGEWPDNTPAAEGELQRLLAAPWEQEWTLRAVDEIEDCHPPIHELSELSHTLALLRWFAQRILPYPCFLADTLHAAARLRVTRDAFAKIAASDSRYGKELADVRYQGILADFLGKRWWRAGIDDCLWRWTDGTLSARDVRKRLESDGFDLPESIAQPVVVIDDAYQPQAIADIEDAVRVQPDDWPPFAEPAWASISNARHSPRLRGLVVRDDRARLGEDS